MKNKSHESYRFLPSSLASATLNSFNKVTSWLINLKVNPNLISILGLIAGLASGAFFFFGKPLWAALLIVFCGAFDILDGKVAVQANKKSLYGAIFDSSLDRYSEFFIYFGLAFYFRNHWTLWVIFFTFLGSMMVSYTRARAEGLGIACNVGIMQRAERMILLFAGAFFGALFRVFDSVMPVVLILIAFFSNISSIQRIQYVKRVEQRMNQDKEVTNHG